MLLPCETDGNQNGDQVRADIAESQVGPDPVIFASEVLGVKLWQKQCDVLRAVSCSRRVAVKSGNGLGKDFTAAVAILWYLHGHDPGIVLSTAPTFRQVRHVLWRQVRALHRRAPDVLGGQLLDTRWELAQDRYALGLSANGADQFQGFHCENMFVVVDEAEGVAEPIYEAVEALMTSANPRLLLIGNPTTTYGAFHRAFHQEIYHTITISQHLPHHHHIGAGIAERAGRQGDHPRFDHRGLGEGATLRHLGSGQSGFPGARFGRIPRPERRRPAQRGRHRSGGAALRSHTNQGPGVCDANHRSGAGGDWRGRRPVR